MVEKWLNLPTFHVKKYRKIPSSTYYQKISRQKIFKNTSNNFQKSSRQKLEKIRQIISKKISRQKLTKIFHVKFTQKLRQKSWFQISFGKVQTISQQNQNNFALDFAKWDFIKGFSNIKMQSGHVTRSLGNRNLPCKLLDFGQQFVFDHLTSTGCSNKF